MKQELSDEQVIEIRKLYANCEHTLSDLGKMFNRHFKTIRAIVKGHIYVDVGGPLCVGDNRPSRTGKRKT